MLSEQYAKSDSSQIDILTVYLVTCLKFNLNVFDKIVGTEKRLGDIVE